MCTAFRFALCCFHDGFGTRLSLLKNGSEKSKKEEGFLVLGYVEL